jgi:hypothetical protein
MDDFLSYLLKVSAGTMLFYMCYIIFFSKDTFYLRNRIYLTGLLLLSIIIPLVKVFNVFATPSATEHTNPIYTIILSGTVIGANMSEKINSFDLSNLFTWFYLSITGFFMLRTLLSMVRTFMIIRKGTVQDSRFPRIVLSDIDHPPFSFFPFVVIPGKIFNSADYPEILAHEKAHIRQGHTFDILLSELLLVFLWFNPFMWLIKRSMILNHEYLADNYSLKGSCSVKEYQYKLLNIPKGLMNVPLAHNFSSLIKNRIVMINKRPTRNYAALKNIIILPVAAILFVMFSFKPESDSTGNGYQKSLFSKSSESEILKFFAMNAGYPQEARNSNDTGKVFVVVRMNKGGVIKDCKAFTEKKGINVPFLEEIVIVGHKSSAGQNTATSEKSTGNEHPALKTESLRVAGKLTEVKIPEWNEKDMEFAIPITFTLK